MLTEDDEDELDCIRLDKISLCLSFSATARTLAKQILQKPK